MKKAFDFFVQQAKDHKVTIAPDIAGNNLIHLAVKNQSEYLLKQAIASGSFAHAPNQKIYISSSAPNSDSIGNNGDIWYQTLS